jgi:hypothetical protein
MKHAVALAVALPSCLSIASLGHADEVIFDCAILSQSSTLAQSTDLTAPFAGTLIGNYDAITNPTGTRSLPGFFGGSGNNPIPYTASFAITGDIAARPIGTLTLGVDSEGLQIRVSGLAVDVLGGVPAVLPATVNINYQTFRTVQPSSLYPGGVTIPVPVGNATVTTFMATQTGKSVFGALVPQKGGAFTFTVAVPVVYTVAATALGQAVGDGAPVPGVLPLIGTLVEGSTTVTLAIDVAANESATQPIEADPFTGVELPLPTVIPTGSTANMLLSGDVTSITLASTLTGSLDIAGTRQPIPADLNGDWVVNAFDLSLLLSGWGSIGPGDINNDGIVSAADMSLLLDSWG